MIQSYKTFLTLLGLIVLLVAFSGCDDDENSGDDITDPIVEMEEIVIPSSSYLNHRFFRLDLPASDYYPVSDAPGRNPSALKIDPASIQLFKSMEPGPPGPLDIRNVAVYEDTTGLFWNTAECPNQDFSQPYFYNIIWRALIFDLLLNVNGDVVAIDANEELDSQTILAVVYNLIDEQGIVVHTIGDRPGYDDDNRIFLPNEDALFYRMKILKAPENHQNPYIFHYVLRNIYSLNFMHIDINTFEFIIEQNTNQENPEVDENEIPYIRIFGLDQDDPQYTGTPDGLADLTNTSIFNLAKGLLFFPLDFPSPFNAGRSAYETYADDPDFAWENTYLNLNQTPELYNPEIPSQDYLNYTPFNFIARHPTSLN